MECQESAVQAENAAFTAEMDARGVTASPDTTEAKDVSQLFKSLLQQVSNEASDLTVARNAEMLQARKTAMASSTEVPILPPPPGDEGGDGLVPQPLGCPLYSFDPADDLLCADPGVFLIFSK